MCNVDQLQDSFWTLLCIKLPILVVMARLRFSQDVGDR